MNTPTNFVTLIFPDGTELSGKSATDVLLRIGQLQWTPVEDLSEIQALLARRAVAWSGTTIDAGLTPEEFLAALEEARMAFVIWTPHPAAAKQPRPKGS